MQKRITSAVFGAFGVGALCLGALGCTSMSADGSGSGSDPGSGSNPPPNSTALEIRNTLPTVSGSSFQCTGTWPSMLTPCGYSWSSQPATAAVTSTASDMVELVLQRDPIPVDGGASMVYIKLAFAIDGTLGATAEEATTMPGTARVTETTSATSGFVDPAVMGRTPDVRNAGTFKLDFGWGTISGTYDTQKQQ